MFQQIGILVMAFAIITFLVASLPIVEAVLGGTIFENMLFIKGNFFWIFAAGLFLFGLPQMGPYLAGIIAIVIAVILYFITGGVLFA